MGILKHNEKIALIKELKATVEEYKDLKEEFISLCGRLYSTRKEHLQTIYRIKELLDTIKNLPKWCKKDIATTISSLVDFNDVIQSESKSIIEYVDLKDPSGRTRMLIEGAMDSSKVNDDFWNSTDAIAVATVIGTATYGATADVIIGESATTAALSWLSSNDSFLNKIIDHGTYGAMAFLFHPIGWIFAGTGLVLSRYLNQISIREIKEHIANIGNELDELNDWLIDLETLIHRTNSYANTYLPPSVEWLTGVSKDYKTWDDDQKQKLEQTLNHISNMANLINERI